MRAGETKKLITQEKDLNLILDYGLSHQKEMAAEMDLEPGYARVRFSSSLRPLNFDGYLNLSLKLVLDQQKLLLEEVVIGEIGVPNWASRHLLQMLHRLAMMDKDYREAMGSIAEFKIKQDALELTYQWRPDLVQELAGKGRQLFTQEQELEQLKYYQEKIEIYAAEQPRISSIAPLIGKLFNDAYARSVDQRLAVAENKALINALAHYISGASYRKLMGNPEIEIKKKSARRVDSIEHVVDT